EEALLIVDADHLVEDLEVHRGGEEVLSDALDLVRKGLGDSPRLHEVVIERADRVDPYELNLRIPFFEIFPTAADDPAGAHSRDEHVEITVRLTPNLRAAREVMRLRIGGIVILIRVKRIGGFVGDAARYFVIAPRIVGIHRRGADHDLGAERAEV